MCSSENATSTVFSIDPKPLGAFIEYTLKPLLDDARELIELLEKHGITIRDILPYAIRIYLIDSMLRLITTLVATGLICWTALHFLPTLK